MTSDNLTKEERVVVKKCLEAIVFGPFIDDLEFETLMGVSRMEAKEIATNYPYVDEYDDSPAGNDDSWLVINNTFANLIGYPHGKETELQAMVPASPEELVRIYDKWRS